MSDMTPTSIVAVEAPRTGKIIKNDFLPPKCVYKVFIFHVEVINIALTYNLLPKHCLHYALNIWNDRILG